MTRPLRSLLLGLLALALALALPAAFAAEAGAGSASKDRLALILESGELRVGLSGDQAPFNMKNKQGELIGMEVDLVNALAEAMGLRAILVAMPFAELLPALEKGKLDMVISNMTITPERNARVPFAGPYFISGKSVLTKSETIANVENTAALDDPKHRFAALAGSTSEKFVKEMLPNSILVPTKDSAVGVQMVIDDEVDALVADFPTCAVAVARHPEAGLSALMSPLTVEPLGIALPPNSPLLVNLVENYLETLEYTGLLMRFKARWLSDTSWISELP
ncbi:MAG: transporter substrate-binding domain-containing protein [Deltaproteobacteria bacterium]|nr:transporter substrate-binding domain-containing protein [Deltaproteobacteria bacterium]